MGMPTLNQAPAPAAVQPQSANRQAVAAPQLPFTRASRKMSKLIGVYTGTLGTNVNPIVPIQLPAMGFMRFLRFEVTVTAASNAATVAFQPDAPFNLIQNLTVATAGGDALFSPLDGFTLYCLNKYGAFGTGRVDPVADPGYSLTSGVGAGAGGSLKFNIRLPFEIDTRDALGALENMAANQSYLLQLSLNTLAGVYSTAPTNPPTVSIRVIMEYWAGIPGTTDSGIAQQNKPTANGSISLVQIQQPALTPGVQNIGLVNVGNVLRLPIFILRNSSGVRDEADWPDVSTFYLNSQPFMAKTKASWRTQTAQDYNLSGGLSATPAVNTLDAGVFVVSDFINDGAQGNAKADGGSNRDLLLVTGSQTGFNYEATSGWGGGASSLQYIQNSIKPSSAQALYPPFVI